MAVVLVELKKMAENSTLCKDERAELLPKNVPRTVNYSTIVLVWLVESWTSKMELRKRDRVQAQTDEVKFVVLPFKFRCSIFIYNLTLS